MMAQAQQQSESLSPLFDLDDVGTTRSWAYDEATLCKPGRYTARSPMTSATFRKVFFEAFPALESMRWDNVCVRGGAVLDVCLGAPVKDLDLFFFGLPDAAAVLARAGEVLRFLLDAERAVVEAINVARTGGHRARSYGDPKTVFPYGPSGQTNLHSVHEPLRVDIKAVRSGAVVTLRLGAVRVPVQLVLCAFPSLAAVAAGADMAVTGALFTGERVLMDADAKWALENMAIRVADGRFPAARRLDKYFNKGFDIVLPRLDARRVPQGYLPLGLVDAVVTPHMSFSYTAVHGNKIALSAFLLGAEGGSGGGGKDAQGKKPPAAAAGARGYAESGGGGGKDAGDGGGGPSSRDVIMQNLALLAAYTGELAQAAAAGAAPPPVPSFAVFAEADFVLDVLKSWPHLTPRQVENTYAGLEADMCRDGRLALSVYEAFVTAVPLRAVLADIAAAPPGERLEAAARRAVAAAVAAQKAASNAALPALAAHYARRAPDVLSAEETFMNAIERDPDVFYGGYKKAA